MNTAYTIPQLISAATVAGVSNIKDWGYQSFRPLYNALCDDVPVSSKWLDGSPNARAVPNIKTVSTYEDCVEWCFDIKTSQIDITMHYGDMMYGHPVGPMSQWTYKIGPEHQSLFDKVLAERIISSLMDAAEDLRRKQEDERNLKEVKDIFSKYFG